MHCHSAGWLCSGKFIDKIKFNKSHLVTFAAAAAAVDVQAVYPSVFSELPGAFHANGLIYPHKPDENIHQHIWRKHIFCYAHIFMLKFKIYVFDLHVSFISVWVAVRYELNVIIFGSHTEIKQVRFL